MPAQWSVGREAELEPTLDQSDEGQKQRALLSVNERLEQRIDASVARLPKRSKKAVYTPTDLNGVQPWAALAGGLLYSAFSYGAWTGTTIAAEWFTVHPAPQDVYIAMRISAVVRTVSHTTTATATTTPTSTTTSTTPILRQNTKCKND